MKTSPINVVLNTIDSNYNKLEIEGLIHDKLIEKSLKFAKKNGLYYCFVRKLLEYEIHLPQNENENWDYEMERLSEFIETIKLIDKISKDTGIDYVIIKACNSIPHVPRDIDIFVRKTDRINIIKALESYGMKCIHSEPTETSLLRKNIKVDIYTEICYIGMEFIDENFLLKSRIHDDIFGIKYCGLNENANFLLMLVHSFFGHRCITLLDYLHLKNIIPNTNLDLCKMYARDYGWGQAFELMLSEYYIIDRKINDKCNNIRFPYLFNQKLVLKCIYSIDCLQIKNTAKLFLYVTLLQDRLIYILKDTPIYNLIKSISPLREFINSLTSFTKDLRGDKKSVSDERR